MWYDSTVHRLFQDDLASVSISRLRASGFVTSDTKSVDIIFGEGDEGLRREVKVVHRRFPNGGEWSFFVCPVCCRAVRILKLHDKPMCRRGSVTATVARHGLPGKMSDDDLVCPPPVSACDHPARRLALCAFHA
jgi:hypothetical protein